MINPEAMDDDAFYQWFVTAPTQAEVDAWTTPAKEDIVTPWRAKHPDATCSDTVAQCLAEWELTWGPRTAGATAKAVDNVSGGGPAHAEPDQLDRHPLFPIVDVPRVMKGWLEFKERAHVL